jgi:hypothetical protein
MNDEALKIEQTEPDPTRTASIAQEIVKILARHDSPTRRRAMDAAMIALGEPTGSLRGFRITEHSGNDSEPDTDLATFFNREQDLKPSDNAQLCAAYHFASHGATSFSLDELRQIASEAGVVLPDRLDMTLNKAASKGRKLFQNIGKGTFKPTAAAGVVFKERWGIRPGRAEKAAERATE